MRRTLLAFVLGIAATLVTIYMVQQARENQLRVPPWHPFELRADLTLDDLVADGYRLSDMPCGMVHFAKTVGDTTIRYWVNIDCEDYSGKYVQPSLTELELNQEELLAQPADPLDSSSIDAQRSPAPDPWELQRQQDPYWPFDAEEVRQCYQHFYWRHYWFTMASIDSSAILRFVRQHGGLIYAEDWNCSSGGRFSVTNLNNNLVFDCSISRDQELDGNYLPWKLTLITGIPFLDQERYEAHLEREKRKAEYYSTGSE